MNAPVTGPTVPLGDLVDILSGFAFKSERFGDVGELPIIRIRDVKRGYSETFYSGDYDDRYLINDGDLLIGMDGEFNRERWRGGKALLNQRVCKLSPDNRHLSSEYLYHFLPNALRNIEDRTPFATVKHLSSKDIKDIHIPLPPLDEQRRIAAILDKADDLRRKRKRAIELLDGLTRSIFLEMFGEMTSAHTLTYATAPFADLVKSQKIGVVRSASELSSDAPTPYLRMDAITLDGKLDIQNVKRTKASKADLAEYKLEKGDFLFNTRNSKELVGKTAIFDGPPGFIYNNNILRVRFSDRLLPEYAVAFFRTRYAQNELELRKSGTTSVFAIYQKSLETLPIALPPIEIQVEFAARITKIRDLTNRYRSSQTSLLSLFSSLQSRAFSGQL